MYQKYSRWNGLHSGHSQICTESQWQNRTDAIATLNSIVTYSTYDCNCVNLQRYIIPNEQTLRHQSKMTFMTLTNRRPYWWGGVVNLFEHVTLFNQSDDSIDQSNCRTAVTCQNKFTTPPHQYGRLL